MKQNVKLILAYDGSRYRGWQKQGNTECTVQGELERVLFHITGTQTEINGSGRTDAGVHARGQVANFELSSNMEEKELLYRLNRELPEDIRVKKVQFVERSFHARLSATGKQYVYQIWNDDVPSVFERKFVYPVAEPLDLKRMQDAVDLLEGTHDFRSFTSDKNMEKSMIRTIHHIMIIEEGKKIIISYEGDGFLYNMVRIMTGTLIEIGLNQRQVSSIEEALQKKDRQLAGFTAPPQGLFLEKVFYEQIG